MVLLLPIAAVLVVLLAKPMVAISNSLAGRAVIMVVLVVLVAIAAATMVVH